MVDSVVIVVAVVVFLLGLMYEKIIKLCYQKAFAQQKFVCVKKNKLSITIEPQHAWKFLCQFWPSLVSPVSSP